MYTDQALTGGGGIRRCPRKHRREGTRAACQISIRQNPDSAGGVGAFYTHLRSNVAVGSFVSRGEIIGEVVEFGGIPTHLHLALGERRNNVYAGVNLYDHFMATANTDTVLMVRFFQDGSAPQLA